MATGRVRSFDDEEIEVIREVARRIKTERNWSGRELGDAIGIAQQNASRFVAHNSTAGMDRTTANKLAEVAGYRDVEHLLLEAGALAEMKPAPTGDEWRERDVAMSIARKLGYPQESIDAVVHRYRDNENKYRRLRWWVDQVVLESLSRAADPPPMVPPPGVNRIERAPQTTPSPTTETHSKRPAKSKRSGTEG